MTTLSKLILYFGLAAALGPGGARAAEPAWTADLNAIRNVASITPGARPLGINVVKFAESRRTKNFAILGAPEEPSIQARTAFQVVYADGTVMIDSGMGLQVHRFFGRGVEEPYFPEAAMEIERAIGEAKMIVITHEHGDHIAGAIRSPFFAEIAPKTVLTRAQAVTLLTNPQMPEIKLEPDQARCFIVVDYDKYFPVAPGMALVAAPGHTPGSQMVYVVLQSGKEYLLAGDVAWHMDGVLQIAGKDAPWVNEPAATMMAQLTWLNAVMNNEPNVAIVISHDEEQRLDYIAQGLLGDGFR